MQMYIVKKIHLAHVLIQEKKNSFDLLKSFSELIILVNNN